MKSLFTDDASMTVIKTTPPGWLEGLQLSRWLRLGVLLLALPLAAGRGETNKLSTTNAPGLLDKGLPSGVVLEWEVLGVDGKPTGRWVNMRGIRHPSPYGIDDVLAGIAQAPGDQGNAIVDELIQKEQFRDVWADIKRVEGDLKRLINDRKLGGFASEAFGVHDVPKQLRCEIRSYNNLRLCLSGLDPVRFDTMAKLALGSFQVLYMKGELPSDLMLVQVDNHQWSIEYLARWEVIVRLMNILDDAGLTSQAFKDFRVRILMERKPLSVFITEKERGRLIGSFSGEAKWIARQLVDLFNANCILHDARNRWLLASAEAAARKMPKDMVLYLCVGDMHAVAIQQLVSDRKSGVVVDKPPIEDLGGMKKTQGQAFRAVIRKMEESYPGMFHAWQIEAKSDEMVFSGPRGNVMFKYTKSEEAFLIEIEGSGLLASVKTAVERQGGLLTILNENEAPDKQTANLMVWIRFDEYLGVIRKIIEDRLPKRVSVTPGSPSDKAQGLTDTLGVIDMDSSRLDLKVEGNGRLNFRHDPQALERARDTSGFLPIFLYRQLNREVSRKQFPISRCRLIPNSEVRGARPPRALLDAPSRPAFSARRGFPASAQFPAAGVFREGAENSARGGRTPTSISEFGLIRSGCGPSCVVSDSQSQGGRPSAAKERASLHSTEVT